MLPISSLSIPIWMPSTIPLPAFAIVSNMPLSEIFDGKLIELNSVQVLPPSFDGNPLLPKTSSPPS